MRRTPTSPLDPFRGLVASPFAGSSLKSALAALAILTILWIGSPGSAQPPARDPSFAPIGMYELVVDAEVLADATILHSEARGTILILADELSAPVHLIPKSRQVQTFSADRLIDNGNGTFDIQDKTQTLTNAQFALTNGLPHFSIDGKEAFLRQRPPLLGPQDHDSLIGYDPSYAVRAESFEPQSVYIEQLKNVEAEILVKVYFGSWCHVCAETMPNILKVEEMLEGTNITFEYFGLEQGYQEEVAKRLNITRVPTGIIYVNGEEVGRSAGQGWKIPTLQIIKPLRALTNQQSQ